MSGIQTQTASFIVNPCNDIYQIRRLGLHYIFQAQSEIFRLISQKVFPESNRLFNIPHREINIRYKTAMQDQFFLTVLIHELKCLIVAFH